MAKNNNLKDFITGVANAIREKKGTTELINPQDFENEILTIQTDSEPASGKSLAAQIIDKSVTDVTAGDLEGATKIGDYAFYYCTGLTSVTIGNSVTSIGGYAFQGCKGLTSITIPNSVTSIGNNAFLVCEGLTSVHITDLSTWCGIAFDGSSSNPLDYAHHLYLNGEEITNLVIPNSVASIGGYAFQGCGGLTSITIPNSVTSIGAFAFQSCTGLTSIVIPDSVTSIQRYALSLCTGLTSVTIPDSVTRIEDSVFSSCTSLTSITIPNSVTSIGDNAFYNCRGLTSIIIPNRVTSIKNWAFGSCAGLTSVKFMGQPPTIQSNTFNGCNNVAKYDFRGATSVPALSSTKSLGHASGCQIVVPDSLYDSWQQATNWVALTDVVWVKASEYTEE